MRALESAPKSRSDGPERAFQDTLVPLCGVREQADRSGSRAGLLSMLAHRGLSPVSRHFSGFFLQDYLLFLHHPSLLRPASPSRIHLLTSLFLVPSPLPVSCTSSSSSYPHFPSAYCLPYASRPPNSAPHAIQCLLSLQESVERFSNFGSVTVSPDISPQCRWEGG